MVPRYRTSFRSVDKQIIELSRGADGGVRAVDAESEDEDRDEEDGGVSVIRDKRTAQPAGDNVRCYDEGDQETSCIDVHAA